MEELTGAACAPPVGCACCAAAMLQVSRARDIADFILSLRGRVIGVED